MYLESISWCHKDLNLTDDFRFKCLVDRDISLN